MTTEFEHELQLTALDTPWRLRFDGDGIEDIAIIQDMEGEDFVASRPFWVPGEGEPVPVTLAAIRVMKASPKLLAFAKCMHRICAVQANLNSTASEAERSAFIRDVYALWNDVGIAVVDEAEGRAA